MNNPSIETIGLIGLGNMGTPMSARWIAAGLPVRGFDLSAEARERLARVGGIACESAIEVAREADALVLMLPDSRVVASVLDELIFSDSLRNVRIVIDMSSSEPKESQSHAATLKPLGIEFIDAPVSGGVGGAASGSLTVMVGGEAAAVGRARPVLDAVGSVHHVGPVGAGDAIKALNNLISATHLWMTSEAIVIAERAGIRREAALAVFNGSSARSGSSEAKWPKFILNGRFDSGFEGRLMVKDTRIATEFARSVGLPSSVGDQVASVWSQAVDGLPTGSDHTEIVRWLEHRANEATR
ncbi:NAD(P)-dependent oxidoreductase [Diaminobutyricibacter sp. McL0618]|uniref:NAD(P)-dependent oxidoreductase n=1 Tax=Leifsonia sp. McL0618 TaxID=3415677 RepID=UPI003CE849E3